MDVGKLGSEMAWDFKNPERLGKKRI